MKTQPNSFLFIVILFLVGRLSAQVCTTDNNALEFDGNGDYIELNPINGLSPGSDFTAEVWFLSTATSQGGPFGNFRRLMSFGGSNVRIELGEAAGTLYILWSGPGCTGVLEPVPPPNGINIRDGRCHHIALVRLSADFEVYLDGVGIYQNTSQICIPPVTFFRVGQWPGPSTGTQEWQGTIDEVRLWKQALSQSQIDAYSHCPLQGNEPDLVAYWQFDQGTAGGNNAGITHAIDASPNGNDGMLLGFNLSGTTSNFIKSCSPALYPNYNNVDVFIQDVNWSVGLAAICEGYPVHFSLQCNGQAVQPPAVGNATVTWEYMDNASGSWLPLGPAQGFQNGFSFTVGPGLITANCSANSKGYVDRSYRARIVVDDGLGHICAYTTRESGLRISCPITGTLQVTPNQPLCEGDQASFNVQLNTNMPAPASNNDVHINWCVIDGANPPQPLPMYDDMTGFTYPLTGNTIVNSPSICFKAVIYNFACPSLTLTECVQVDLKPVCSTIQGLPPELTLLTATPWLTYEICPGDDAQLQALAGFQNCKPSWQYSFDMVNWTDMGATNTIQNTNTLPTTAWGTNTSIFYQIQCNPLTTPSGCPSCISNKIEVKLKPPPPAIVLPPDATICYGQSFPINISSQAVPGVTYTWYCNGLNIGTGTFFSLKNDGCYWVEANDGCQKTVSNKFCLTVCLVVAKISCPLDPNPCACPGIPITLTSLSVNSCGNPLDCRWDWVDANGVPHTFFGCTLTDTPDPVNGTKYTLTVTDPITGCSAMDMRMVVPCQ